MKILETKVMRGPNVWSNYRHQIIVLKIDLEELEAWPSNKIEGFGERLKTLLPSLYYHRCSEGREGGFFHRIEQGTWMGHVIEHIALEIQSLAGMEVGYGRTRSTGATGIYNVVFSYELERAGVEAGRMAVAITEALIAGQSYDLEKDLEILKNMKRRNGLGPSTQAIVAEALKRNIPVRRLNDRSMVLLGLGKNQRRIRATITDATSNVAVDLASDKDETKNALAAAHIPVPKGVLIRSEEELQTAISEIGFPIVLKPLDGNHGRGITTNILNETQALQAFQRANQIADLVIVEKFIRGDDYRFLVVNYKLVAASHRTPASVKGDGISTISELIGRVNNDPRRGDSHENVLTKIVVDQETESLLKARNYTLQSVLPNEEVLLLKHTANISSGGTAADVTDLVHPYNKFLAERAARIIGLDICGIDIIANDISKPLNGSNGAVLEVNAAPGFRMHVAPSSGIPRNVAEPVIDMLFPNKANGRIPLIAVTGTNGKTTTVRLLAHLAKTAGYTPGCTTTEGIYIGSHLLEEGDCSGPRSAAVILTDPTVDFAVLECARGGILRSGLGFDKCDVSIVTNISADHLGLKDIHTLEDMAEVKSVVPKATAANGFAILNADDDLVYRMRRDADCNVALFSMDAANERIANHCERGGWAAFIQDNYLVVSNGKWQTKVEHLHNIPITFNGTAEVMIRNLLPATLAAVTSGFDMEVVREGLRSFVPSPETNPGRLNIFPFKNFDVMIDYAHNVDGFQMLGRFLQNRKSNHKIGIIAALGDRRNEDIIGMGKQAAAMFDEIIIRQDKDTRGKSKEELCALLSLGIKQMNSSIKVSCIDDEQEALLYAMKHAPKGAFITLCTDKVYQIIEMLRQMQTGREGEDILYNDIREPHDTEGSADDNRGRREQGGEAGS
ncbi:MAG: cyanophycin synthetase [Chitinophagales bacterium]